MDSIKHLSYKKQKDSFFKLVNNPLSWGGGDSTNAAGSIINYRDTHIVFSPLTRYFLVHLLNKNQEINWKGVFCWYTLEFYVIQ
jgi:hypothetical protein